MAGGFTQVYRELDRFWDAEAKPRLTNGHDPLAFRNLLTVDNHRDHMAMDRRLTQTASLQLLLLIMACVWLGVSCVTSRPCSGRHVVLFVGYQAEGTPGRNIQRLSVRNGYVAIDRQRYDIRAQVHTIGGYSAHADQAGLLEFVSGMRRWPSEIRIVHREDAARQALRQRYMAHYQTKGLRVEVSIPSIEKVR